MVSSEENINHETITDPVNDTTYNTEVQKIARERFNDRPANFLIVLNKTDQVLKLRLNQSDKQIFIIDAVNGSLVLDRRDLIRFSQLEVINDSGSNATGDVYLTYSWLYKDIVGAIDE